MSIKHLSMFSIMRFYSSTLRKVENGIRLEGVQSNVKGIEVNTVGSFNELGDVFLIQIASANILSFAAIVDKGAKIQYLAVDNCFT